MAKQTFHATISEEPSTGAIRGKLPATMVREMDAGPGDVIEFVVQGERITSGRVLSSKEAREYKNEIGRGGSTKKTTKKSKKVEPKKSKKKAKRKTRVDYDDDDDDDDEDERPKKKAKKGKKLGKIKLGKKKKNRR